MIYLFFNQLSNNKLGKYVWIETVLRSTVVILKAKSPLKNEYISFLIDGAPWWGHCNPRVNKNGVLWSQAHMRIEMRLRCYLVIGNLQLVNGNRQLAINNWSLAEGNGKRQLVIGQT